MATIELAPALKPVLERVEGEDLNHKLARLLAAEFRRFLEECEREMLDLEIKYRTDYQGFVERLEAGEFGDPFSYELERDAMRWQDLQAEKRHWMSELQIVEDFITFWNRHPFENPKEHIACEPPVVGDVLREVKSLVTEQGWYAEEVT